MGRNRAAVRQACAAVPTGERIIEQPVTQIVQVQEPLQQTHQLAHWHVGEGLQCVARLVVHVQTFVNTLSISADTPVQQHTVSGAAEERAGLVGQIDVQGLEALLLCPGVGGFPFPLHASPGRQACGVPVGMTSTRSLGAMFTREVHLQLPALFRIEQEAVPPQDGEGLCTCIYGAALSFPFLWRAKGRVSRQLLHECTARHMRRGVHHKKRRSPESREHRMRRTKVKRQTGHARTEPLAVPGVT